MMPAMPAMPAVWGALVAIGVVVFSMPAAIVMVRYIRENPRLGASLREEPEGDYDCDGG